MQAPMSALGFRVTVTKWLSLVRLLLGEVPEHTEFTAPGLAEPLAAYFSIAQAVRAGDLTAFRCTRLGSAVHVAARLYPGKRCERHGSHCCALNYKARRIHAYVWMLG